MLYKNTLKPMLLTLGFELEINIGLLNSERDYISPVKLKEFIDEIEANYHDTLQNSADAYHACEDLKNLLKEHDALEVGVTKDDMKEVYRMLQERELHPHGTFDNAGRFYLTDSYLVDVRAPSRSHPYSHMVAGRTAKFVKAIAECYKVQSKDELISLFKKS